VTATFPLAAVLLFALGGAAWSQEESAPPSATFVFHKSYDTGFGLGRATVQTYYHLPAGICRGRRRQAAFTFIGRSQRQRSLPAGRPLTLWMMTQTFTPGMENRCQNAVTFTPRPGATYDVALRSVVGSHCEINIVESGIGLAPEGLSYDNRIDCA
jgi:hypothetical protein